MDDLEHKQDQQPQSWQDAPTTPVVGLGASAGGLQPLLSFFAECPSDTGLVFVVVQHLPPKGNSALAEILMKSTAMPVEHIVNGMDMEPDRVYVLQPSVRLTLMNGTFQTQPLEAKHPNLIINEFFSSLASHSGEQGIAIVLSGTGTDGSEGVKSIREAGGLVLVQSPDEAQFDSMPTAAIRTGVVDAVVDAGALPAHLLSFIEHASQFRGEPASDEDSRSTEAISKIIKLVSDNCPNDFTRYKDKTLTRRIIRRMGLCHVNDAQAYLQLLQGSTDELDRLYKDLLISVTGFFRDRESMQALDELVLTPLVESAGPDDAIRIWVPGCATGEEAYSLAILLHERIRVAGKRPKIQIFATDIDENALTIARHGVYPDSIRSHVSDDLLQRYFRREGDYYRVTKDVREEIVFTYQNLISGAPFSQLDLIACRNLLIYLKLDLQNMLMNLFHFALRADGNLFLGSSETIGRKDTLFRPLDRRHRIYRRKPSQRQAIDLPFAAGNTTLGARPLVTSHSSGGGHEQQQRGKLGARLQRHLLDEYAPPAVLASKDGNVLYFFGETSRYLKHPTGEPSQRLFDLARSTIRSKLRVLFRTAVEEGKRLESDTLRVGSGAQASNIVVAITPLAVIDTTHYLVTFEPYRGPKTVLLEPTPERHLAESESQPTLVHQLEDELQATRAELQSSIDDLETLNQDLKVSHEEAISMNEELQSSNEELETSKEELQSLNEEMSTVNSELQTKVDQLDQAYSDLDNLLKSITAATLFIDASFCIGLFTPNCKHLFNLVPTDIGRPLNEIKFKVGDTHLLNDARVSLETLESIESEVAMDDLWYLRRISPYRTNDNKINGVVITYTDITRLKMAQNELSDMTRTLEQRVEERTEEIQEHVREREQATRERDVFFELSSVPFFVMAEDGYFQRLNPTWSRLFGWDNDELHERPYLDFIHPEDLPRFRSDLARVRNDHQSLTTSARFSARDGSYSWLEWEIQPGKQGAMLGVIRDVSERTQSAHAVQRAQEELEKQVNLRTAQLQAEKELAHVTLMSIGEAVIATDNKGRVTSINPVAERLTGWLATEAVGRAIADVLELRNEDTNEPLNEPVSLALQKSMTVAVPEPAVLIRQNGESVHVDASVSPVYSNNGELLGAVAVFFDVSYSRELAKRVRHRASHDDLTGLVNRGEFEIRLKTLVAGVHDDNRAHALLFMDLDRFKIINDTCGHVAGDELLRQIADELKMLTRQRDTLARMGGDEFALILENCNPEQAMRVADDMLAVMRNFRFTWEDKSFHLGMSVGIALIDERATSAQQIVHNADSACYLAKEAGRDRAYIFDQTHDGGEHQDTYLHWVARVSQALEQNLIEIVAQPIVALATGLEKGSHFEILARLKGDDGEMIPPSQFINAAERYNLMPRLDRYIVNKVFTWLADNPKLVAGLDICSINLSVSTLGDDRFPGFLKNLIDRHNIPTHKVCFEITETMAIRNLTKTIELAEEFKRLGFLFSLDDFGSGFASYHYLRRLPVDFLKIDGEFVRKILDDPMDEAMVRSMNEIGHIMGKKTIAEFVESEPLLAKLREIGVDYVQGFTVGEPDYLKPAERASRHSKKHA